MSPGIRAITPTAKAVPNSQVFKAGDTVTESVRAALASRDDEGSHVPWKGWNGYGVGALSEYQ